MIHLTILGLFPSKITTSHCQELLDQLGRIEQNIASLEMADRQGQDKEDQGDMYNLAKGASRTHPSLLSGNVDNRLDTENRQDTGDLSTVTVAVNNDRGVLSAHVTQANAGINAAGLPSLGQSGSQVFTPLFYERLTHPQSHLLKELPVVVGNDVNLLYDILLKVLKIRQVGQMTESTIYEIIHPYCRSDVVALVTNAVTAMESFEIIQAQLLGQIIPSRYISQLRAERYERAQFDGESITTYVQSIRDAALVLRISEDEAQVVERIVEGLTPTQRAHFVF